MQEFEQESDGGGSAVMDLSFVPEDNMLKELERRFDAFVFVGNKTLTEKSASQGELGSATITISGNPFTCAGLVRAACKVIERRSLTIIAESVEDDTGNEDKEDNHSGF